MRSSRSSTRSAFGKPQPSPMAAAAEAVEEELEEVRSAINRFKRTPSTTAAQNRTPLRADSRRSRMTPASARTVGQKRSRTAEAARETAGITRSAKRAKVGPSRTAGTAASAARELREAKKKLEAAQADSKARSAETKYQELKTKYLALQKRATDAKDMAETTSSALAASEETVEDLRRQLQEQDDAHQEALRARDEDRQQLEQEMDRLKVASASTQGEEGAKEDMVRQLRQMLQSCQKELSGVRASHEEELRLMKEHYASAQQRLAALPAAPVAVAAMEETSDGSKALADALEEAKRHESDATVLRAENQYLKAALASEEQLKEHVSELEQKVEHLRGLLRESTKEVQELRQHRETLARWEGLLASGKGSLAQFQSSEELERHLCGMQQQNEVLAAAKGQVEAEKAALVLKVKHRETMVEQLEEKVTAAGVKYEEEAMEKEKYRAWFDVLRREKERNRLLLDTFSLESSEARSELTSQEDLYLKRIEELERDLVDVKAFIEAAMTRKEGGGEREGDGEGEGGEKVAMLKSMVEKLEKDKKELQKELAECQERLGHGQMDPRTTKVLRLRSRPPLTAYQRAVEAASDDEYQQKVKDLEETYAKLRKQASFKIKWFREIVFHVVGWQLDVVTKKHFRLLSVFNDSKKEYVDVRETENGFDLVETQFIKSLDPEVVASLMDTGGIPLLLANLNVMLKEPAE